MTMKPCDNGSDSNPCNNRPELTYRMPSPTDDPRMGRWLGTVCGRCAADLIEAGKATRTGPFTITYREASSS